MLFLKDYANYIQDEIVTNLTDLDRNMMLSIDILNVPTDEAVREVENRLLGVETNITNWQRRQNQNNNFSAIVPYDMELQRRESKEFLSDLTTRDQRMMQPSSPWSSLPIPSSSLTPTQRRYAPCPGGASWRC